MRRAALVLVVIGRAVAADSSGLDRLRFLSGDWVGQDARTSFEEIWSAPANRTMTAMYREMEGGRTTFYEFLVMSEEEGRIVLRMKHFDKDFTGWEEKDQSVVFDATEITSQHVKFVSRNSLRPTTLDYSLKAPGRLEATLIRVRDGKTTRDEFHYRKNLK